MLLSFFFIYYIIFIYSNYFYIIFSYTNLPCFVKRPREIVIDWALYKYFLLLLLLLREGGTGREGGREQDCY